MKDEDLTKDQLVAELRAARRRVAELEQTERAWKSAAAALRQSEESLQTTLDSIGDGVIATDTKGRVVRLNPVAEGLTGWRQSEAEGRSLNEVFRIFNAHTREEADNPVGRVLELGKIVEMANPIVLVARDGRERQVADSAAPIFDVGGNITGVVLVFRDVTEAYETQQKLRNSEEKLRRNVAQLNAIINALPGIVSVVDTKFNVLLANDEALEMFGQRDPQEVLGKSCHSTRKGLEEPCPQCALHTAFETGDSVVRVSTPEEEELMGIATKAYSIPLKDEAGEIWGGVEVIVDITDIRKAEKEFRESEEKYRSLINGMRDTVWVIDMDGGFIDMNTAAVETLGYSRDELVSMGCAGIDANLDQEAIRCLIKEKAAKGLMTFETAHVARDGTRIPVEVQSCLVKYSGQGVILAIARDITERKRAEEERLRLKKLESVGVLAGGIAHDFNNLLTSVFGNIEMGKQYLSPDHRAYVFLEAAGQAMDGAMTLTKQLLTFSRGGDPVKETVSIGEALEEAARFSLRGSSADLQTRIDPYLWPVEADRGQLIQVISNLVINADQAMPEGGIVRLEAANLELPDGRYVEIAIKDDGVGIAAEDVDRIFDPYFTRKQKGSGLGLAVTHSIVSKHGGTIAVDSSPGEGTAFRIRLQAAEVAAVADGEEKIRELDDKAISAHVLVLDDEEAVRNILAEMLKRLGHRVSHAATGQEAISKYREALESGAAYDIVIMDLTIRGGLGGKAAAREILAIDPEAKLIVSSGYATDPVMANYEAYGFVGVVAKPYRFADLRDVVGRLLKA